MKNYWIRRREWNSMSDKPFGFDYLQKILPGKPACEKRWKRLEILSTTSFLIFKDDHAYCGAWSRKDKHVEGTEEISKEERA